MTTVLIVILSIMLLSWCFGMDTDESMSHVADVSTEVTSNVPKPGDPYILEDLLNRNFVTMNGRKTSLRTIYGDILPTARNFKGGNRIMESFRLKSDVEISSAPPSVNTMCASSRYTQRTFSGDPRIMSQSWTSPIEDTPTVIAEKLKGYVTAATSDHNHVTTLLTGDARVGKSVALAKIQHRLIEIVPSIWTIRVDFDRMYPTTESLNEMTFENIINKLVRADFSDLFYNLLAVNPKKIVILFDGIEHLTDLQSMKAITIIRTAVVKRAVVILTGHMNIVALLEDQFKINAYRIGEMTIQETEQFLTNIWQAGMIYEIPAGPSTRPIELEDLEIRLKDYVQAFAHTLFKTLLPRQPVPLMILAETFKRKSSTLLRGTQYAYPVACYDYMFNPSSSAPPLFIAIENVLLDKNALYENIVKGLNGDLPDLTREYGTVAMEKIIQTFERSENAPQLLKYVDKYLTGSKQILENRKESAIFINFINGQEIEFIHPEFKWFFAAKFMSSGINDANAAINLLEHFLKNYRYSKLLEFLNFQVKKLPAARFLSLFSHKLLFNILDNLIINGHENLFLYIFDHLIDILKTDPILAETFHQFILHDQVIYDKLRHVRILGMTTSSTLLHPNPFEPTKTSELQLSRMELLVKYDMMRACEKIETSGVLMLRGKNKYGEIYRNLLRNAVIRTIPNFELVKFLMHHVTADLSLNEFNTLLYETINNVGDGCQHVANYLVSCGAQPNVRVKGRTLLHAAVKWNSQNLLRYVMEELFTSKVPAIDTIDDSGRSVFATALDANASPLYTFAGWWEMMSYLVNHIEPVSLSTMVPNNEHVTYMITREDINTPDFELMFLNSRLYELNYQYNNLWTMKTHPIERDGYSDEQISKLTRFIPYTSWRFSENMLAFRRYIVLHRLEWRGILKISPLEMLVYYRGARSLQPVQHIHYRKAVMTLLRQERDSLAMDTKVRIYKALWDNVADTDDLLDCLQLSLVLGPSIKYDQLDYLISDEINRWQSTALTLNTPRLRLHHRLSQTRLSFMQGRFNDGIANVRNYQLLSTMITRFHQIVEELNQGGRNQYLLQCLRQRFRRSAQLARNCLISWKDVDQFNDAVERRVLTQIRVNSNNFLQMLAAIEYGDASKAQQLVSLVQQLQSGRDGMKIITGKSKMVVQDLLRHGSLIAYRQNQRVSDITNNFWHPLPNANPKSAFLLPSRTMALYAASSIPLIRGLYGTIIMCLQQSNDTDDNSCFYGSSALALSATLDPVGAIFIRYTPWMVNQFSRVAHDILPSTTPPIWRENAKIMRYFGLKYGAQTINGGLAIAGIGFDLYNIIEMSKMIDKCTREAEGCPLKDKVEYIISLTFSCVSIVVTGGMMISGIGFVPGLLIGLGLMGLEELVKGVNDVIHYSNNYNTDMNENFRIFWHKVALQPPPADVQALARRTEWINSLRGRVTEVLTDSNENIVAYGIGIGNMINNGVIASSGSINMENVKLENTRGLSRIIPTASENTTLLCLPLQNPTEVYDNKYPNEVKGAKYRCKNTFVMAHKERWNTRISDKSYIIYDLGYVDSGTIVGSNTLNNLFSIYNGTQTLEVIGGSGNTTNTYIIQKDAFRGVIILHRQSAKNILHFSDVEPPMLYFSWNIQYNTGRVQFGNNTNDYFSLYTPSDMIPNLHVIGRAGKLENFTCNYNKQQHLTTDEFSISIDGGGGQSSSEMDYVIDCKVSIIRPFTHIIGSNSSNVTYTTYISLDYTTSRTADSTVYATIQPRESKFIVIFANRPLLANTYKVEYETSSMTLLWNMQYTESSSLLLSIAPYRSPHSILQQNTTADAMKIEIVNCVFIDSYLGTTIFPVISQPADGTSTTILRNFNIFATVNSSRLSNVFSRYRDIAIYHDETLFIVTKLTNPTTGQTFMFGSNTDDRFYIDANTTCLFGGDGRDVYVLSSESPNYIWILNEADDNALDTLIIPDTTCDLLSASRGSLEFSCCDSSYYDVTLSCSVGTVAGSPYINVILRNYFLKSNYRHLQIYWHDAIYVVLPIQWTQKHENYVDSEAPSNIDLALFFSFGEEWQTTALTLTSRDTHVVFNMTDATVPLVVYRSRSNDVIIAQRYLNRDSSSIIILQNFLSNDTNVVAVSTEWQHLKIFIVSNINDVAVPTILSTGDILDLFFVTLFKDATHTDVNADFVKEYFVDITDGVSRNNTIIIEHNNSSQTDEYDRLGVLMIAGAKPGEFHADWVYGDDTSLSLCAHETCIIIKNWCRSIRHRLYRIEFISTLDRQPIVIRHMDQLECLQQANNNNDNQLLKLNEKFSIAQKQLLLTDENDDNDDARLVRCIGSIFADNIAHSSVHRLFGFTSNIDHMRFIHDNCPTLFTRENLEKMSLSTMNYTLQNTFNKLKLSEITKEEQQAVLLLHKSFAQLSNRCWVDFKSSLYNHDNTTESNLNQRSYFLSRCI